MVKKRRPRDVGKERAADIAFSAIMQLRRDAESRAYRYRKVGKAEFVEKMMAAQKRKGEKR